MMKKFKAKSNPETPKKTYSLRSKALEPSQTENIVTNESSQQVNSASGAVGWGVRFDVFSRKWRVTRDGRHGGDFEDLKQANKCKITDIKLLRGYCVCARSSKSDVDGFAKYQQPFLMCRFFP